MLRQQQNANRAATILGQQEQNTKAATKIVPEQQFVFRPTLQK